MRNSERTYVDLLFRASKKYASWDPEMVVKVGDWGRITEGRRRLLRFWRRKNGTFLKEGNIYTDADEKAKKYGIPEPTDFDDGRESEGETWIVSMNAKQLDTSVSVGGTIPALAQCKVKGAFKFSSGRGAILVMENDTMSFIDPPGALRKLLQESSMHGFVVVSEVHSCASYARLLTANAGSTVALGLHVEPPVPGVGAEARANAKWVRNGSSGNFKSQIDKKSERRYYPLFRLVSLAEKATSTGLRSSEEEEEWVVPPLPDAEPPWLREKEFE